MFQLLASSEQINIAAGGQFAALGDITFPSLISALIILIMVIAAIVFLFMLILGGVKYITSGGDKGQTESARSQITAALIGLVIVFAAWAVVSLVTMFFGVNLLQLNIQSAQTGA
jgi:hypothetical protein